MPLESTITIEGLNTSWPLGGDGVAEGDDHVRQEKSVLKNIFPGLSGNGFNTPILSTEAELNKLAGMTSSTAELNILTGVTVSAANINDLVDKGSIQTITGQKTIESPVINSPQLDVQATGTAIKDENDMVSDSAVHLATQRSIKAYVDSSASTVLFDDPVSLGSTSTKNSWITLPATGVPAGSTGVIVSVQGVLSLSSDTYNSTAFRLRKTGTSGAFINVIAGQISQANTTISTLYNSMAGQGMTRIDASGNFDLYVYASNVSTTGSVYTVIVGYVV